MRNILIASLSCLLLFGCSDSPEEESPDAGAQTPGCGDIGEPASGTCQTGSVSTTPIRGLACTDFSVKFDGVAVPLSFDRHRVGKTVYEIDGSTGALLETKPTLDGCGATGFASLNFRDGAGAQRLALLVGNNDFSNPSSNDASTHDDRSGCLISAEVWDADGDYVGLFQSPTVDGIYLDDEEQALALQSGTYSCTSGMGSPLEMTFNAVKLVNLHPGTVGAHTLELHGKLSVTR